MPLSKSYISTNRQKISALVHQSHLSLADQTKLIEAFSRANDADLEGVLKLFSEDSSWIERMSENYKAKHAAFVAGNSAAWQDILREEEAQLKELEG